jgi:hypothetical protein
MLTTGGLPAVRARIHARRARIHRARLDRARRRVAHLEVVWALAARDLRDALDDLAEDPDHPRYATGGPIAVIPRTATRL